MPGSLDRPDVAPCRAPAPLLGQYLLDDALVIAGEVRPAHDVLARCSAQARRVRTRRPARPSRWGTDDQEAVEMDAVTRVPVPVNEPVGDHAPGSPERAAVEAALADLAARRIDLPGTIGGREVMGGGEPIDVVQPHARHHVLGTLRNATHDDAKAAVEAARAAAAGWRDLAFEDRAAVLLKAAELLAGPWRAALNAATMLGQSKTAFQAEIDSACELIDFLRFNVAFGRRLLEEQPQSSRGVWNRMDHRPLEGFVYAITPFNFTAIAGNLPSAPALLGNVVVWKPSPTQQLSAHYLMALLHAAG
ncbi:MAG TPA: aldehyde dehydrogenase family protein, partial [Kineosporiaceae bacterium]